MTAVNYETEKLIGGEIKTNQVPLAAGTYYRGMPLEYDSVNSRYKYLSTLANAQAVFLEDQRTVTNGDIGSVIIGGEIQGQGLVDNSNNPIVVTTAMIDAYAKNGLYIKKK